MSPERRETARERRGEIQVGTVAWAIPSRYKDQFSAEGSQLQRYARAFSVAEVDTSFYKHHQHSTYERWAQSVGERFRFAVKLPKALTHEGQLVSGASTVRDRFFSEVAGLGRKWAVLLVQLPPGLAFDKRRAQRFFAGLRSKLPPQVRLACEPRHASWGTAAVDELLGELSVSRVAADPARWEHDAEPGGDRRLSYFRWHGVPRVYFSNYEAERLAQIQQQLVNAATVSDSVWGIFDNTAHGHAVGNALWMQRATANGPAPARPARPRRPARSQPHPVAR